MLSCITNHVCIKLEYSEVENMLWFALYSPAHRFRGENFYSTGR